MPSKQENVPLRDDKVYRPPERDENEVNIDELLGKIKSSFPKLPGFKGGSPLLIFFVLLIIALFWIGSGVYTVDPDEVFEFAKHIIDTHGMTTMINLGSL